MAVCVVPRGRCLAEASASAAQSPFSSVDRWPGLAPECKRCVVTRMRPMWSVWRYGGVCD